MLQSLSIDSIIESILPAALGLESTRDERVLFVLSPAPDVDCALMAAHHCARRLGGELHLLRVVPPSRRSGKPPGLLPLIRETQRVLAAARRARRQCDRLLPAPLPTGRICVRIGALVEEAARRSAELDTRLIVMARGRKRLGPAATALALRTGRHVLVPAEASPFSLALLPPSAPDAGAVSDARAT